MAMHEYRAISKGTLSRPYRFFNVGDIIRSPVEIDHPALIPASQPVPRKSDILVPYMTIDGRKQRPDYGAAAPTLAQEHGKGRSKGVVPAIKDKQYERGMDGVKRLETMLEAGSTPVADAAGNEPAGDGEKTGGKGTGNQEVI